MMTKFTMARQIPASIVVYAGALLIGMTLVSVPASSVFLIAAHGLSDQQYGQVFLPQLACAIAGALLAGPAVKRLSLKTMYVIALVCFGLSQMSLYFSATAAPAVALNAIMVSTAFFGFGFGFGGGPLNGLVANLYPQHSDTAITALHLMAGVGLMIGPLYFRAFESNGAWALAPSSLAVGSFTLLVLALVVLASKHETVETIRSPSPAGSGYFWLMIAIAFLYALVEGAFSNWAIIFVTGEKSGSADTGAQALAVFWGGLTLGRLIATLTVARVGAMRMWMSLPILMLASFVILPSLNGEGALILGYGLAGLACSAFFPLMVAAAARPFPEHVSWIASMLTASLMLGVGIGSYVIGGAVSSVPISRLYLYFAALPAITLVLMWLSRRDEEHPV